MKMLDAARRAKHKTSVASSAVHQFRLRKRATYFAARQNVAPFHFRLSRYADAHGFYPFDFFLQRTADVEQISPCSKVPDRLWCFWTGDNPLTPNRERALQSIREANRGLRVTLVTPSNLEEHLIDSHPLHEAFPHLSAIHKSDYLRAYFMHHHGGAYSDIKPTKVGFVRAIQRVETTPTYGSLARTILTSTWSATCTGQLGETRDETMPVSQASPHSSPHPIRISRQSGYARLNGESSYHAGDLRRHPAVDPFGLTAGYPITWIGLGADVFQPLQLKYLEHVVIDNMLKPGFTNYR